MRIPSLIRATNEQEIQFARAIALLAAAIEHRAFPGAVLAVAHRGRLLVLKAIGKFTYDDAAPIVHTGTVYDLASVTKVVATTCLAMLMQERGQIDLETPLIQLLPEFEQTESLDSRRSVTLRMLLAHTSGLPAYAPFYTKSRSRKEMLAAACEAPLEADPGAHEVYSDIGFILLGAAMERAGLQFGSVAPPFAAAKPGCGHASSAAGGSVTPLSAGCNLQSLCRRDIFEPLGLSHTGFCPAPELRAGIPPTEDDRTLRLRVIQGEVQDANAAAMGGIAGHAGLFASALDLAIFAECMLQGGAPILQSKTVALFTSRPERNARQAGAGSHALGWDTPSPGSQAGQYFSPASFGHLGYTGTSVWIDPARHLSVILLTNRTWPDCRRQLVKQVRPAVHDAVVDAL